MLHRLDRVDMVVVDPRMGDETEFIQVVPSVTATGVAWLVGARALQPPKTYEWKHQCVFKLRLERHDLCCDC